MSRLYLWAWAFAGASAATLALAYPALAQSAVTLPEVVVTLLAVLELVRLQRARAQQRELFGDIVIERASGEGSIRGA